jgi:hypothetical protein
MESLEGSALVVDRILMASAMTEIYANRTESASNEKKRTCKEQLKEELTWPSLSSWRRRVFLGSKREEVEISFDAGHDPRSRQQ